MTYRLPKDFADESKSIPRLLGGLIRRMAVTISDAARWQLLGQRGGQGGDETVEVENFSGIGFYARPPSSGGKPEAIVAAIGGAKAQVIVATRDEATRAAMAGGIDDDETAVYNSHALLLVKADGTIEVGSTPLAEPTLKATTYRTAQTALSTAMEAFATAVGVFGTAVAADPTMTPLHPITCAAATVLAAAGTALAAAVVAFESGSVTYPSTIAKVT